MASFERLLMQHRFLTVVLAINTTVFLIKWYNILMSCPHSQNWTMNDWTLGEKMHCPQLALHILPLLHMPRWNAQEPDGVDLWEFVCNMIKSGFSKVTFIHSNWKEALEIAVQTREANSKGEKERYNHLNAEFQWIARKDKKIFLSD